MNPEKNIRLVKKKSHPPPVLQMNSSANPAEVVYFNQNDVHMFKCRSVLYQIVVPACKHGASLCLLLVGISFLHTLFKAGRRRVGGKSLNGNKPNMALEV